VQPPRPAQLRFRTGFFLGPLGPKEIDVDFAKCDLRRIGELAPRIERESLSVVGSAIGILAQP